ncbi:OmpA family protein [bacterium]|nr:OmpA family protein [bacterium]
MAKKKPPEEHENLERWLVSYGDFITLLFATFVVLYALAQTDVNDFAKLEEALKNAFSQQTLLNGQEGIMNQSDSIFDNVQGNSIISALMVEFISPKYEDNSFKAIEREINRLKKEGELEGITAKMTEEGLLITFDDRYLFTSGSAALSEKAKTILDKIGVLICEKFVMHNMRVEGHTDNKPIASVMYPSNWELSSARACSIVRYLIDRFKFFPSLFTAVGYADTRPVESNDTPAGATKNRRVEILILKNKFKSFEKAQDEILKMSIEEQQAMQRDRAKVIKDIKDNVSPAAKKLLSNGEYDMNSVVSIKDEPINISEENKRIYSNVKNDMNLEKSKARVSLESQIPQDEDFGL